MQALHRRRLVVDVVVISGSDYAVGLGGPPRAPIVAVAAGGVRFRAAHAAAAGGEAWSRKDAMTEVRRKESAGDDVFSLVAQLRLGAPVAMGIVITIDEMFCGRPQFSLSFP